MIPHHRASLLRAQANQLPRPRGEIQTSIRYGQSIPGGRRNLALRNHAAVLGGQRLQTPVLVRNIEPAVAGKRHGMKAVVQLRSAWLLLRAILSRCEMIRLPCRLLREPISAIRLLALSRGAGSGPTRNPLRTELLAVLQIEIAPKYLRRSIQ